MFNVFFFNIVNLERGLFYFIQPFLCQELNELRASSETFQLRIDHVDGPKDYDSLLRDKLQELRDEFEDEAENAKEELESAYRSKVYKYLLFCTHFYFHMTFQNLKLK